jgi:dTMP kinase
MRGDDHVAGTLTPHVRGRFIALEGLDGAGTTTASRGLAAALEQRGVQTVVTCQPSDRSIGTAIRGHLRATSSRLDPHALALLFAADRLDHVHGVIEPALAAGTWVICDRYVMSSWAYQGIDCDPQWVRSINARAPWPDLTLVLDVAPEVAAARVAARAKERETPTDIFDALAVQRRVAAGYAGFLAEGLPRVIAIDATQPPDAIVAEIVASFANAALL